MQELKRLVETGQYEPSGVEIATGILNSLLVGRDGRLDRFHPDTIGREMLLAAAGGDRRRIVAPVAIEVPGMVAGEPVWVIDDGSDDDAFYKEYWTGWNTAAAKNHRNTASWRRRMRDLNAAIRDEPVVEDCEPETGDSSWLGCCFLFVAFVIGFVGAMLVSRFWH